MMKEKHKVLTIAVLLTCHNRKEKTLTCLSALFEAEIPKSFDLEVFLVDDGSTDGTGEEVKLKFPLVRVIQGNGNLFWNQGMRLAWKSATEAGDYDFYLWLNDDTVLDNSAILDLISCSREATRKTGQAAIIAAACRSKENTNDFSYGGRIKSGPVIPNGILQFCTYINGNAVLVPREVFEKLGNLSSEYTHGMGDFDYGLRAIKKGIQCYTTKHFIATCPPNKGVPGWCNPKVTLKNRWQLLHSPRGLNLPEYLIFRKKFWGNKWRIFVVKAYAKALFPKLYSILSN